jgi:hypothetical protein
MIDQQAFTRQLAEYVQGEAAKIVDEEAAAASKRVEALVARPAILASSQPPADPAPSAYPVSSRAHEITPPEAGSAGACNSSPGM